MYVLRHIEARSPIHFCPEKAISVTCSESVFVVLVIQRITRMLRTMLSSVASLAVPYFIPHYLINGTVFKKRHTI
jgi:hypothetical protein